MAVILDTKHPAWEDFCEGLFTELGRAVPGSCDGTLDKARSILNHYSDYALQFDIDLTLQYFAAHGGYCDCEVLLNVDHNREEVT